MIWLDCMQWSLHLSNGKIKIQLIIYLPSIFLIWESNGFKLIINLIPNDAQILRYPQNLSRISRGMFRHVQQYNNKVLIPNFLIFIYLFIYFLRLTMYSYNSNNKIFVLLCPPLIYCQRTWVCCQYSLWLLSLYNLFYWCGVQNF